MTFKEKYEKCLKWHEKVLVIELYHLVQIHKNKNWTLSKTAEYFSISMGLVSENLKLASAIHQNERIMNLDTRQEALRRING